MHDFDAHLMLKQLVHFYSTIGLLRYDTYARIIAYLWWEYLITETSKSKWENHFKSLRSISQVFKSPIEDADTILQLQREIKAAEVGISKEDNIHSQAAEYLYHKLLSNQHFAYSQEAWQLCELFNQYLKKSRSFKVFQESLKNFDEEPIGKFEMIITWVTNFVSHNNVDVSTADILLESAIIMMSGNTNSTIEQKPSTYASLKGMYGDHKVVKDGSYQFHFNTFNRRLSKFVSGEAEKFTLYIQLKKELLEENREAMRLNDFKPRVLSSFVRNKLIDEVYLPLIGDNLAKQIGAAGGNKRTDLMGMLLLISPPGYGKTTLMEYVASRLGLIFMKINGPAIGHQITSLDPASAKNSASREELQKLNLAFEMGDNVMIYLDDIQHCSSEFLQKFISLCDAQRKIEGVYKGKSKTYDFRGKKVAVIMAGNPYTESGDKFQIPDMLANRADIYNLGDILGDKDKAFKLSYLENSLTSNSVLSKLKNKSQKDINTLIGIAETGGQDGLEFDDSHSPEEIKEYVSLFQKMLVVRDIILLVNKEYILSAGQAEEFRVEPPFKLQGSYRNMNKIVEKLNPLMNDKELNSLILSHYENESQTLTQGAEFNLLKFKKLFKVLTKEDALRKEEIQDVFKRNQKMQGLGGDKMAYVLEQMEKISVSLGEIAKAAATK